ncbi:MAG: hypothetical protein FWC10_05165 [Lentimicrobiaceae bacterium]|nr:hypothetical protein [Lentimicrobiaceae bacterium]
MIKIYKNQNNLCPLCIFWLITFLFSFTTTYGQNNRLTNENGQLLWQYSQTLTQPNENSDTLWVTFVFTNGINQTAITLRQELFYSQIQWIETSGMQAEKEDRVEFLTANLAPNQSIIWRYALKSKKVDKDLLLEKSALLIMNDAFEVRKEVIPEQKVAKEKVHGKTLQTKS